MDCASWPASEKRGICAAAAVFLVGILLAAFVTSEKIGDSVTFVALLLVPLIVYGIASGKIQEFSGPGGWGAKFREAAMERVSPEPLTECIQNFQVVEKGGLDALKAAGRNCRKGNR